MDSITAPRVSASKCTYGMDSSDEVGRGVNKLLNHRNQQNYNFAQQKENRLRSTCSCALELRQLVAWNGTSSMMSSFTSDTSTPSPPEPFFRVMTSHFSGVVTIIWLGQDGATRQCIVGSNCDSRKSTTQCALTWVVSISRFVSCMSPVSSRTDIPRGFSFSENFSCTSCASAFIGATYTILKSSFCHLKVRYSSVREAPCSR
jgi:hypothetical protein